MANCTALDAANFISSFISNAALFSGLPEHYQNSLSDASFYCNLRQYVIEDQLQGIYQNGAARQLAKVIGVMSSVFVTIWVMMQGTKIMNGTMRTPILELGFQAAKMVLVLSLISLSLGNAPWIAEQVTMFQESIATFVTGSSTTVDDLIDFNVAATSLIDLAIQDLSGKGINSGQTAGNNSLMAGWLGQAGPAMTAATLLLMARVAIVFGIMLSPLFLFFFLFEKTNTLFWGWAKLLMSLFFAMAALSVVTVISLQAMSQYGFRVFLSILASNMDPGAYRATLVSVLTESINLNANAAIDVGGGLTRLAMMGTFFTGLLLAVPTLVMTYFGAAIGLVAQGMRMDPNNVGSGGSDRSQASGQANGNTSHLSGPGGQADSGGSAAGSATFNRQIQQSIASKSATQGTGADGAVGTSSMLGSGARGQAAVEAGGGSPGLRLAQRQQQTQAANGELRENKATGIYETAETAQQLRQDSSLGTGGHLKVAEAAPAQGNALPRVQISDAQKMESTNNLRAGESVSIGKADAPSTPVHAVPPPGVAPTVAQPGRPSMHGAAAAHQGHHPSPRPAVPFRGK